MAEKYSWTCDKCGALKETQTQVPPSGWFAAPELEPRGEDVDASVTKWLCDRCSAGGTA